MHPTQHFTDYLKKTLMLGMIEGRRRSGWQRMSWLGAITNSMDMSLSKLWETVKYREDWHAAVHGVTKYWTWLSDWLWSTKIKSDTVFTVSLSISHEVIGPDAMILIFWMLSFKPTFSLSSFTFIKRLFSSSSLSAIRLVSSAYLRLLIFLLAILIPPCVSSSPAFLMMHSAYELNKQGDNIQPWCTPFPIWTVCCSMSSSNWCFLTCIQVSQEVGQLVWYSHLFQNFPQFTVIHTVEGFGIVNKAEIDVFLLLFFWWSSRCWQFDLWFLCLF